MIKLGDRRISGYLVGISLILGLLTAVPSQADAPPKIAHYVGHRSEVSEAIILGLSSCDRSLGVGGVCFTPFAIGEQRILIDDLVGEVIRAKYEVSQQQDGLGESDLIAEGVFCDEITIQTTEPDIFIEVWILDGPGPECPDAEPGTAGTVHLSSLGPGVG